MTGVEANAIKMLLKTIEKMEENMAMEMREGELKIIEEELGGNIFIPMQWQRWEKKIRRIQRKR